MGVLGWIALGLVAGALAKAIHRGEHEPGGCTGTLAVGIVGALLGGFIAAAAGVGSISSFFDLGTWLIAVGGALLVLIVYNAVLSRARRRRDEAPRAHGSWTQRGAGHRSEPLDRNW
jgi:uncharacterized membrane protein YeaQ/YmgE (transglycosylase-associated protein family)